MRACVTVSSVGPAKHVKKKRQVLDLDFAILDSSSSWQLESTTSIDIPATPKQQYYNCASGNIYQWGALGILDR